MAIYSFDGLDDVFERMRQDKEAADARVQPWQRTIRPGDYILRKSNHGFRIYSEILADPEERDPSLKHYRFTRSYSMACPDGELGDIHISTIERKLSEEEFDKARATGWRPPEPPAPGPL